MCGVRIGDPLWDLCPVQRYVIEKVQGAGLLIERSAAAYVPLIFVAIAKRLLE